MYFKYKFIYSEITSFLENYFELIASFSTLTLTLTK